MKLRSLIKDKKRGSILDLFIWIIISFILLVFFGAWVWSFGLVTDILVNIESPEGGVNVSAAAQATFGQVNNAYQQLRGVAILMIFGFALSIPLTNFLAKSHPALALGAHIFITALAIVVAVFISNSYESLLIIEGVGPVLQSFTGGTFIMLNLPLWTSIIGVMGFVFLSMGITRDSELGGGLT